VGGGVNAVKILTFEKGVGGCMTPLMVVPPLRGGGAGVQKGEQNLGD